MKAETAVIYLRVSTERQAGKGGRPEGFSIPAQRQAYLAKAESLGLTVVNEYVEAGESARSADRPELQQMLSDLAQPSTSADVVIVHKLDRLARNTEDNLAINISIREAGARLVSCTESIDDTPSRKLIHTIFAGINEFYSGNLGLEAKKGLLQKVKSGGTPTRAPAGYLNVGIRVDGHEVRTVEIDPELAPHIKWMFKTYATGDYTLSELTEELAERVSGSR